MATKQKPSKSGKRPSKPSPRGVTDPAIKTYAAATQPGRWHTGGGGTKSRSYRGK
jgi:hypothetical protein